MSLITKISFSHKNYIQIKKVPPIRSLALYSSGLFLHDSTLSTCEYRIQFEKYWRIAQANGEIVGLCIALH